MPQKHSTVRDGKRLVWYTQKLWELSEQFAPFDLPVEIVRELDMNCWFDASGPTLREMSQHFSRIQSADLDRPIILNDDGSLMDGGHRLCKALVLGHNVVKAVQFDQMPSPDEIHLESAAAG